MLVKQFAIGVALIEVNFNFAVYLPFQLFSNNSLIVVGRNSGNRVLSLFSLGNWKTPFTTSRLHSAVTSFSSSIEPLAVSSRLDGTVTSPELICSMLSYVTLNFVPVAY